MVRSAEFPWGLRVMQIGASIPHICLFSNLLQSNFWPLSPCPLHSVHTVEPQNLLTPPENDTVVVPLLPFMSLFSFSLCPRQQIPFHYLGFVVRMVFPPTPKPTGKLRGTLPSTQENAGDELPAFSLEHSLLFLMNTKRLDIIILFTHCYSFTTATVQGCFGLMKLLWAVLGSLVSLYTTVSWENTF